MPEAARALPWMKYLAQRIEQMLLNQNLELYIDKIKLTNTIYSVKMNMTLIYAGFHRSGIQMFVPVSAGS